MIIVAKKMAELASALQPHENRDAFGRSAFNRCYYATYLIVREMLAGFNPGWKKTPHKKIPDILEEAILNRIKNELKKQERKGTLKVGRASNIRKSAMFLVSELGALLKIAYSVRCVADYEPEKAVLFETGNVLKLEGHSVSEATKWADRASEHTKNLIKLWRDLGLG